MQLFICSGALPGKDGKEEAGEREKQKAVRQFFYREEHEGRQKHLRIKIL